MKHQYRLLNFIKIVLKNEPAGKIFIKIVLNKELDKQMKQTEGSLFLQNKRLGILECFPGRYREKRCKNFFFFFGGGEGVLWVAFCPSKRCLSPSPSICDLIRKQGVCR